MKKFPCLGGFTGKEWPLNGEGIVISSFFLGLAHYYREKLTLTRKEFPENISAREFHNCSSANLQSARSNIRATCTAFNKEYKFIGKNKHVDGITEYGKKEIEQFIEDIQEDLVVLQQRMTAWNNPPYSNSDIPDVSDNNA